MREQHGLGGTGPNPTGGARRQRMGNTLALALLVYTALQIGLAVATGGRGRYGALPYAGLALLVVAIIPACRALEARWARLGDGPALERRFWAERAGVWGTAIGLPPILTGLFRVIGL